MAGLDAETWTLARAAKGFLLVEGRGRQNGKDVLSHWCKFTSVEIFWISTTVIEMGI